MVSKKPKASRHRIPFREMTSDPVTPEYQAEVDQSMADLERRYAKAEKALQRAEQKRQRIESREREAARARAEAEQVAENRAAEESLLAQRIGEIKEAAKRARVSEARRDLERQRDDFERRRAEFERQRKLQLRRAREEQERQAAASAQLRSITDVINDHHRELREIEKLMMPGNYAGGAHRGTRSIRHQAGGRRR